MADGSLRTPGSGETIASDDIGGVKYPRSKISVGADGSATDMAAPSDGQAVASLLPAALMVTRSDGLGSRARAAYQDALADSVVLAAGSMVYDGASGFDRMRGNIEGTLLASAARTVTSSSALTTNHNARGIMVMLNVTVASGTGGLTIRIIGADPVSGAIFNMNAAPTAVTTTGVFAYELYPGASSSAPGAGASNVVQRTAAVLPRKFYVYVTVGDASSYTYSVGYSLIV